MKLLVLLACTTVTASLAAQTFVVDALSGPGANFNSIAVAIASVPDGAMLLVRPGTYGPFTIVNKSVTVLCESGASASYLGGTEAPVTVRDLAPHQQVTIRGLRAINILGGRGVAIRDCAGTVLLDTCSSIDGVGFGVGGDLRITNSDDVRVQQCLFAPSTSTACSGLNSNVRVSASSFSAHFVPMEWFDSTVELVDTTATSSQGWLLGVAPVTLSNSNLRVLAGCVLTATTGPLIAGSGTVRIDPRATLANGGSTPPFGAAVQVTSQVMPSLTAETNTSGGIANARLRGPNGGLGVLYVGLSAPPTLVPPFVDAILLAPGLAIEQAFGTFGPDLTASYTVPLMPLLLGVRVTWQGASIDATAGAQISNAVTYVHW